MKNFKIAIGADHAGFELKEKVVNWLKDLQPELTDIGTFSNDSVDYPDFAHAVAGEVEKGNYDLGILICGTGIGVDMTANKHQGIRSALCWNKDIARLARSHNKANIICLPGRFITFEEAKDILDTFLNTEFEGGRHQNRINKIGC
jgi:ribose 5-phosphate isomerase B